MENNRFVKPVATISLDGFTGSSDLIDFLLRTKQATHIVTDDRGRVMFIVNQFCKRHHRMTEENTYVTNNRVPECKQCRRMRKRLENA